MEWERTACSGEKRSVSEWNAPDQKWFQMLGSDWIQPKENSKIAKQKDTHTHIEIDIIKVEWYTKTHTFLFDLFFTSLLFLVYFILCAINTCICCPYSSSLFIATRVVQWLCDRYIEIERNRLRKREVNGLLNKKRKKEIKERERRGKRERK